MEDDEDIFGDGPTDVVAFKLWVNFDPQNEKLVQW